MLNTTKVQDQNYWEVDGSAQKLLFHVPSTALFYVDEVMGDILDFARGKEQIAEQQLYTELKNRHSKDDLDSALSELKTLSLLTGESAADLPEQGRLTLDKAPLTTLVLNVNTGCNLSCSYCYKEDLDTPANGKKMDFATAVQSIDMLLAESPDIDRYNIVFFGGEPLTNLSLIKQVIEHAEQRFSELHKQVDFSMTTNATLLDEDTVRYLDSHRVGISISIDGPKALHDRNRITVGGKGTYQTVEKKARILLSSYRSRMIGARVTLTTGVTDVVQIWDHLFNDLGFHEVGFAPVTSGDMSDFNLSQEELSTVFSNFKALGRRYLEAALEHRNIGFSNLHQLLTDIHEGRKKALPCGAGVGMVAIDHQGGVNLCHRFTGSDQDLLGTIQTGIDKNILNDFLNQRLEKSSQGCASCQIRNLCAGGCYHESYSRFNDPASPTFHYCELMRDWVYFGIQVYSEIMEKNPAFYDTFISPRSISYEAP